MDNDGAPPPLFAACQNGHVDVAHLLIEKGADVNKTWNGKTPLDMVKEQGNIELVRFLRQKYVARWYAEVLREHNARFRLKDN